MSWGSSPDAIAIWRTKAHNRTRMSTDMFMLIYRRYLSEDERYFEHRDRQQAATT